MKNFLILLGIGFLMPSLTAQIADDLLKNPNITWAAETNFTYKFEAKEQLSFEYKDEANAKKASTAKTDTYKIDPDLAYCVHGSDFLFSGLLQNMIVNNEVTIYNPEGTQKWTAPEVNKLFSDIDTITTYDPETFEETIQIVHTEFRLEASSFRVHQLWYFDQNKNTIQSKIIGLSPMITSSKKGEQALFYMELKASKSMAELTINSPNVAWMKQTRSNYDFSKAKVLKGDTKSVFKQFFKENIMNGKTKAYASAKYPFCDGAYVLKKDELNAMYDTNNIDTIITFDPATYKEETMIVKTKAINFDKITDFRLVQRWYFDAKNGQMQCELIATGPIIDILDANGNFRYSKPLYFIDPR